MFLLLQELPVVVICKYDLKNSVWFRFSKVMYMSGSYIYKDLVTEPLVWSISPQNNISLGGLNANRQSPGNETPW